MRSKEKNILGAQDVMCLKPCHSSLLLVVVDIADIVVSHMSTTHYSTPLPVFQHHCLLYNTAADMLDEC